MGKYIGSPWGHIRGKLGDFVGGVWKGIEWNRILVFPTQRGTLDKYRQLKDGIITPEQFSYPQMNIRRAVVQVLGYIARFGGNLSTWIYPVWHSLVIKRGWIMTGSNAFVRRNAATLLNSMPDKGDEFDPDTNVPDLLQMLVSDGDLEGAAEILTATYDDVTGDTVVTWDTSVFTNGDDADLAFVLVAKKPILESVGRDGTWAPKLFMYGTALVIPPPGVAAVRVDGTTTLSLPAGLTPDDLTAYLFFRDAPDIIGYSISLSSVVVAAGP